MVQVVDPSIALDLSAFFRELLYGCQKCFGQKSLLKDDDLNAYRTRLFLVLFNKREITMPEWHRRGLLECQEILGIVHGTKAIFGELFEAIIGLGSCH